jgi:3-oxoisoapionate kinase
MTRLISFYGDDFTGSTDVMEALATHGVEAVLFTRVPTAEEFAPYAHASAIGVAGTSRSQTPEWMNANMPDVFAWLKSLDARFCHYKVCSTFDSAPLIGSIGRAIDIAAQVFGQRTIPLVVGAPQLKRYTFAAHLFAGYQGETYRIDRHPVMSKHPITPMHEADLRLHLSQQTAQAVRLATSDLRDEGIHLLDVFDAVSQAAVGQRLLELPQNAQPFVAGSSGVEYALVKALTQSGGITGKASFSPVPAVERMLVVSGSVSPTTERQIATALQNGFTGIAADPLQLMSNAPAEIVRIGTLADTILKEGGSPLVYTAMGPSSDKGALLTGDRSAIGRALGIIAKTCMARHDLKRLVIAGGDSSSHALAELDVLVLKTRFPLAATPGSPLCDAVSARGAHFELALKGGQVGSDRYFIDIKNGFA